MVINYKEIAISLPEDKLLKVKLKYLDLHKICLSVNFAIDEYVSTSYVNNSGYPSSTTKQSFPPATADSSCGRREVLSRKNHFQQQLETGASMVDKALEILNETSLLKQDPQVVLQTDASLTGQGAALPGKSIEGTLSFQKRK